MNHNKNSNVNRIAYGLNQQVKFVYAKEDIKKGAEIFIDYAEGINDPEERNSILKSFEITEEVPSNK